jgi:hypothetical protein
VPQDNPQQVRYDYTMAGFDAFLSRSIDSAGTPSLGVTGTSRAIAFDKQSVGGAFGDTVRIGRINLNGAEGNITLTDGENVTFIVGDDGN